MADINNEEEVYHYSSEEREYCFGGTVADDYFTIDINKCKSFNRNLEMWRREAAKNPENVFIQYEDNYHVIIKAKRSCIQFPKPRTKKELTDEQRKAISDRMKQIHS